MHTLNVLIISVTGDTNKQFQLCTIEVATQNSVSRMYTTDVANLVCEAREVLALLLQHEVAEIETWHQQVAPTGDADGAGR